MFELLLADLEELSLTAHAVILAAVAIATFFAGTCVTFSDDNEEGCDAQD